MLPDPPTISEEEMQRCRESGDFRPVLFEWYKFVGSVCVTFSCIRPDSPALNEIPEREYTILIGLLNRCSRLMLANVALSHEGKFGETTSIVDRCIFESCVLLTWLCRTQGIDRFDRYIANGLKSDLELKEQILANIAGRNTPSLKIEKRMLESIDHYVNEAGISENQIASSKRLPDLASMISATGKSRLMYTVGQRLESHHVHGTWVSLRLHYLEKDEVGRLAPRDHDCPTHVNQYIYIPNVVLDALSAFVEYVLPDDEYRVGVLVLFESVKDEVIKITEEVVADDFTV